MNFEMLRNLAKSSIGMNESDILPMYHEECEEKIKNNDHNVCDQCQNLVALKNRLSMMGSGLELAISELEQTDKCMCEKRGEEIVCQYDLMFEIGDAFFSIIQSKYVQLVEDEDWLLEEGRIEEARKNKEAVETIFKAMDDYEEFKSNKFHSHQRIFPKQ